MGPAGVSSISSFAGVCLMAACFGRNLTHLHRPTAQDREEDLNGEFWKRHRQMDTVLLNTSLSMPENLRLPSALSDPNAVFLNMCLHTSAICLHQAAIFKADKHRLPVTVTNESKIRCVTAAAEIASIMRMISHLDLSSVMLSAIRMLLFYANIRIDESVHFLFCLCRCAGLRSVSSKSSKGRTSTVFAAVLTSSYACTKEEKSSDRVVHGTA
jgi:hypothetical protein